MDYLKKLIIDCELHSPEGLKECFENGISPNQLHNGKPLIEELTSEYTRSERFKDCVQVFVDYGLEFENTALLSVLLDDGDGLEKLIAVKPDIVAERHTLKCAYTPLENVTLLHICTEFNHLDCAKVLVKYKADVNEKAGVDEHGFGGQTPIFHAVNQHKNYNLEMLKFLITQKADLKYSIMGLIWGKGYEWETFIPSVNPISYAMMGLLRQFQRTEHDIYELVKIMMKAAYGMEYDSVNIPNKYLKSG